MFNGKRGSKKPNAARMSFPRRTHLQPPITWSCTPGLGENTNQYKSSAGSFASFAPSLLAVLLGARTLLGAPFDQTFRFRTPRFGTAVRNVRVPGTHGTLVPCECPDGQMAQIEFDWQPTLCSFLAPIPNDTQLRPSNTTS